MHRLQGVLNIPVNDKVRIRAGADWNQRDGYLKSRSGIGPKDFHDVNYWAGRFSVDIDLTQNLENYTIFTYSRSNTHGSVGKIAFGGFKRARHGRPDGIVQHQICLD